MKNTNDKIIECINNLIAIVNDGMCGYENASQDVNDATLKELFRQYSDERAFFALALKNEVKRLGGDPEKGGDTLGALHRTWMDIKSTITTGDRDGILKICITGEEAAVKAYSEQLKNDIPDNNIRDLLNQQLNSIQQALNNIRSLENTVTSNQ